MYTKGHWTFDGEEWVSDEEGFDVAHIGLREKDEMIANGYLITAAPDLIKACQMAIEYMRTSVVADLWEAQIDFIEMIVARATRGA